MSIRKRTWLSKGTRHEAWIVDYFDQAGARHIRTFKTKKQADAWSITAKHEVQQGIHSAPSTSITVTDAFERWIAHCEAEGLEYGTILQRRQHLALHIAQFIGRERLASLNTPRLYQFDAELRKAGRSVAMRRKVMTSMKSMLGFAQGQGLVAQNAARGVKIKSDDRQRATGQLKEGRDYPSKAEIKLLLDNVSARWRAFITVAIFTGLRASELRGLRWSDVDLEAGKITVSQRADNWRHIGPPKSIAGRREVPLVPMAVNALKQWKLVCPAGELGLAFPNGAGNIELHPNIVQRVWDPLQVRCGIVDEAGKARYGFHSLRHAAASLFIAHLGWPPKRVQAVLGHASIVMTFDRYGHLFADDAGDKEAMKKLEAAITAA
jgi:integrase